MGHMGKLGTFIVFLVVVVALTAGVLYFVHGGQGGVIAPANPSGPGSPSPTPALVLPAATGTPSSGQTISDGTLTFVIPADFGLAVNQPQVLVRSYIPPCDQNFNYCLYYDGGAYQGTNFDSAGIRIKKRTDLTSDTACLTAAPTGYTDFTPTSTTANDYSLSEFTPLGNAGAGHMAIGTLYRLAYNGSCYEFETRIGQSQFANYPSGTIAQFTQTDQAAMQTEILDFLNGITLSSGAHVSFPQ